MMPPMEKHLTDIKCNDCDHEFVDRAWYEEDINYEQGRTGWILARAGTRGVSCHKCGSPSVQAMDERL